jgi:hypothetical protein
MAQPQRQTQVQIKVLRIGIVQDGKIVKEELIKSGDPVTIGDSEKNTFQLAAPTLGKRFQLFEPQKGGTYNLVFTDGMTGRVSYKDDVLGFDQLKTASEVVKKSDGFHLPLNDSNRGKIIVDGLTILFQFVPPPPEPLGTSMDFRPKFIDDDDPIYYGFLSVFFALGIVFGIITVNAPPRQPDVSELPDRFTQIISTPPSDEPPPPPEPVESDDGEQVVKKEESEASEKVAKKPEKDAAARREQAREQVMQQSRLLMAIIGTRGESASGSRVEDLLGEADFAGQDLDSALANVSGAEVASSTSMEARTGTAGGRRDADIGDLQGGKVGAVGVGSGPAVQVSGKIGVEQEDAYLESGDAAKVKSVVKKQSGQVKYCYESQLKANPTLAGRVEITFLVKAGRVTSAKAVSNSTGSDALGQCIVGKVKSWRFDEDVVGEFTYPFSLTPSS